MLEAGPVPPERRCSNCGTSARAGDRYCGACGSVLAQTPAVTSGPAFCRQCGAALDQSQRFCIACGAPVTPDGGFPEASAGSYPLHYEVQYPEKLSRLLIFVKWLLAIPHFLVVTALGYAAAAITVVAFFAILFTRRYPRGLFNLVVGINRWGANVTAYTYLFRDEYPPFSLDPGKYPVLYEVEYPEQLSRWWIWVKWLLVIPHQFVITLLSFVGFLFAFFAWFAILFTGRYPRTFFDFNVGLQRWILRVTAYAGLLRDEFPPYSKRADAKPGSRRAVVLSAVFGVVGAGAIVAVYVALIAFSLSRDTEVVEVSYADALAGRSTTVVDLQGTIVTLEDAEDPFRYFEVDESRPDTRHVAFELWITNEDALFTFVDRDSFTLEDTDGEDHDPVDVFWLEASFPGDDSTVSRGETVLTQVVFEIDDAVDPLSLTYSSAGPLAFGPIGEDVRFEFR